MSKHDPSIEASFSDALAGSDKMEERDLLDALKPTIIVIEKDDSYSTNAKLKIFALITSLSNCAPKERPKFVKKISKALK